VAHPIAIYVNARTPADYPFSEAVYHDSYRLLAEMANARGMDLRFVLGADIYRDGVFRTYWTFEENHLQMVREAFTPALLYVKSRTTIFDDVHALPFHRVNAPALEAICRDKYQTYRSFPEFVKPTLLVDPHSPDIASLRRIVRTNPFVLKPRFGGNGTDVRILDRDEITDETIRALPEQYIAQEIIDSDPGIAGVVTSRHEIRLFVFDGEVRSLYMRIPREGSYLSNISQGATVRTIALESVPHPMCTMVRTIDTRFAHITPRLYTIDAMMEGERPWLVELNDQPGVPDVREKEFTPGHMKELLDFMEYHA
jgi:glutathione synthase/RimK-type ligase-like ATP-grasp enzyme